MSPSTDLMVNLLSLTSSPSSSILRGRTLSEYIAPLLRADAKTYTTAEEFIKRNSTFFTSKLDRPPYTPTTSPSSTEAATVPMQALHTAAAALTLVPPSHWTVETHRANITSYDGSDTVTIPAENADGVNPDKLFKKELYHYLRWALSASAPGPGIPEIMTILGREETVRRIQDAKALTQSLLPQTGRRVPKGEKKLQEDRSWMGTLAPQE